MAVLRLLALACLAACYAPDLRDCAVTCASSADCAAGQVCGSDAYCAAPDVAGSCAVAPDAAVADPDAPPRTMLRVAVMGPGTVTIAGVGTCTKASCSFDVVVGALVLRADPKPDSHFEAWTGACEGQGASCSVSAIAPETRVGVTFVHGHD